MKLAYFDCFNGISGDMVLGALADAGLDFSVWKAEVEKLGLEGYSVSKKKVRRAGFPGTKVTVKVTGPQPERKYSDIKRLIEKSGISPASKKAGLDVFRTIAEAEARAHGVGPEDVHFHEVGAVDSIIDIVGSAIAIDLMGVERIVSSPLNLGSGMVRFSHGTFPVPAPATAEVIKSRAVPVFSSDIKAELTTPTGAAIITTLADGFGPMPQMNVQSTGWGAGDREFEGTPNMLRVFTGESADAFEEDEVIITEANIDDMDPRIYEYVMERLFEEGALDVWLTPIIMKKSRPAVTLSAMAAPDRTDRVAETILFETTTFGIRSYRAGRKKLEREFMEAGAGRGTARVKIGRSGKRVIKAMPEYEDIKMIAKKTRKPLREVLAEIIKVLEKQQL